MTEGIRGAGEAMAITSSPPAEIWLAPARVGTSTGPACDPESLMPMPSTPFPSAPQVFTDPFASTAAPT